MSHCGGHLFLLLFSLGLFIFWAFFLILWHHPFLVTAQHNHLIHVCVFKSFFPYYVDLCSHSRTDTLALIHTHSQSTYMLTETHTVQPLFFCCILTVLWLCPSPLLVEQSDYCRRSVCALAFMRSLWRLAIVWPKSIFVVAQPLRTGLGQSLDPRTTQMPFISCLVFLCLSHSSVVLIWCFPSCFVCGVCFFFLLFFFLFPSNRQRCQKWSKHIWKNSFFLFWIACWNTETTSAYKTMNCTLTGGMCFSFRWFFFFFGLFCFFCFFLHTHK